MKVSHHEVRVVQVAVSRQRTQPQTRQSTDCKQEDERQRIAHGRIQLYRAFVHSCQPIENFDRRRNRYRKRQSAKDDGRHLGHTAGKHVVSPDQETEQGDRDRAISNEAITEDRLVAVNAHQFADDTHAWQNHDVYSRVRVEPEEVLEHYGVTIELWVENTNVEYSFRC